MLAILLLAAEVCAPVATEAREAAARRLEDARPVLLQEHWAQAEPLLREAAELDPSHPLVHYGLGQALMGLQRPREAAVAFGASREAFRCLLTASPELREMLRAALDRQIRKLRDAIRELEHDQMREQMIPWHGGARPTDGLAEGRAQARMLRELQDRLHELEKAKKKGADPAPPGVTLALGTAFARAGAWEDAERELRAALAYDPKSADVHNNLAVVYLATGRLDEAEEHAKQARKRGAPNERLLQEIARLRR